MISKILSISSNKSLKPSGREKGVVVSSTKGEVVVKLSDSTVNLSVLKSDLKAGDEVSVSFSKDAVNIKKVISKLPSPKDLIKFECSDVIRKVISQIDQIKNIDNESLNKTLSNLSESIKKRELHILLLEKSIEVLKKENESIKLDTGKKDKEIEKLVTMLDSLKKSMPQLKKPEILIQNSSVKISIEGDYKPQIIINNSIDELKKFFDKLGVSKDLLKNLSSKNGPFMISVTPNTNASDAIVEVSSQKDLHEGMVNLQKTLFKSHQLKSVSPEILLDLLKNIEIIKPDSLIKLDNLFLSADSSVKQNSIKDGVIRILFPQLISIFSADEVNAELLNKKLSPIVNEELSQQLVEISKDQDIQKLDPQIEKVVKEITFAVTSDNKKDLIPILFKLTGLSNESDVLKLMDGVDAKVEVSEDKGSIKHILANIIKIINNDKSNGVIESTNNQVLLSNDSKDQSISSSQISFINNLNKEIAKFSEMKMQVSEIVEKIEIFQNQSSNIFVTSSDVIKIENTDIVRDLVILIDQIRMNPDSKAKNTQEVLSNLLKNVVSGELNLKLLENTLTTLEAENETIKLSTGKDNKEISKLIFMLSNLKDTIPQLSKNDIIVQDEIVKTVVKGEFKPQLIMLDKLEDVNEFFNKHNISKDLLKNISPDNTSYKVFVTPTAESKEAVLTVYPQRSVAENVERIAKPLILSSHIDNRSPDLLMHLLKNNKNPNIISDVFSLINQLKNLKTPNHESFSNTLIKFAKSIASGKPSLSLLNNSINVLEKENELIKNNRGTENKELSKLISTLVSLKKLVPDRKNVNLEIHNNRMKFEVEGKFKPQLIFMDKMSDLKSLLNKMKIPQDLLKSLPSTNGPFMVSVTPNSSYTDASINIYPEKNQQAGTINLQKNHFHSSQLKSASPDLLLELMKNIESLKPGLLSELDNIFKSTETTGYKKNLSDEIIRFMFPQFSSVEVDNDTIKQKLLPLMDDKLSQQFVNLTKNHDIEKLDPQINKGLKELSPLITNENKKSLIPILFKLAELSNDNEFSMLIRGNSTDAGLLEEKGNVKSILLKMLQIINKAENESATEIKRLLTKDQDHDTNRSLNEQAAKFSVMKKQVTQIIEKIEAFQILAKSVPTSSGESQLITLPINYGGEWVDLQLRISHQKRESSKKNDRKRITVELNIELSAIGEVSAEMEYFKNKEVAINITLSNKKIVQWFENNKSDIEIALRKLNLNNVKLNFRTKKAYIKPKEIVSIQENSNFDIVG